MTNWSINFSVSVKEIDDQHKVLISIINEATELIRTDDCTFNTMYEMVTKMDRYVVEHFQFEEKLMFENSYPELEEHVRQHNQFRYDMEKFNIFDVKQPKNFIEDALVYLMDWLTKHIMSTDKRFGNYINGMKK